MFQPQAGHLPETAAALQAHFSAGSEDERCLAKRFLHRYALIDERHVDLAAVARGIRAIHALAGTRSPGEANVDLTFDGHRSALLIVTDDTSFLVDSVTLALAAAGRTVDWMLHPQLVVSRDAAGTITRIHDLSVDDEFPEGAAAESWMLISMAPAVNDVDRAAILSTIRGVLADVQLATSDWHAMMKRASSMMATLRRTPPAGFDGDEVAEAVDLLQWLLDDNFTFLGFGEFTNEQEGERVVRRLVPGTELGILRGADADGGELLRNLRTSSHLLSVAKASTRSTVHRRNYVDTVAIATLDDSGAIVGERRILGLFTSEAYAASVRDIPLIRRRVQAVMDALELVSDSHSARDLLQFLETYPRDELFQTDTEQLVRIAASAAQMRALRQSRIFVRFDDDGRFASCLIYLPRDRYNTMVRRRLENLLCTVFGATSSEYTALVTESLLARIHFVLQLDATHPVPVIDAAELELQVADATKSWDDHLVDAITARVGEDRAAILLQDFAGAFPEAYKEDFEVAEAVEDILSLEGLVGDALGLRWLEDPTRSGAIQFKVNRIGDEISVSRLMPYMQHMGLEVIAERPYCIERASGTSWVLDFDLRFVDVDLPARDSLPDRAAQAFRAAWLGQCDDDRYNALVVLAGLTWQEAAVLRAYGHYLKQINLPYGQGFLQTVLAGNVAIARLLIDLFQAKFSPDFDGDRTAEQARLSREITRRLDAVPSLDQDRVLRAFLSVLGATLRTNAYLGEVRERQALSLKLATRSIADAPRPRPKYEVWVSSPRVEGVHLRFGDVARGGLRWSDRSEDFRTEVLGLVKAQEVKNAVIVPVGAKGGFVPSRLPDPTVDRAAWLAEGQAAYREYLSAILDLTDNLVGGSVVPPQRVVRHDGDDAYLVVAADKGTATFSDIANAVAHDYGFWLDDAFASGGSVGYDHKAMGITARGAWEAVKRHFRELGLDTQTQDFTAVGIGDMSGDVFGNGMLLSPHLHLVAAFDHRDIFIDPMPDAASALEERSRLFALPRSSWADYDPQRISRGGGVYSRSLKTIPLTPEARAVLGLPADDEALSPNDVIAAILRAPVDLLWNGGIGTYVKARTQSHADVGDKANDAIRVNGDELRCRVIGEGGNLGCTQLGRIEAARCGVRVNTDAIDNSAGVDTSDHEVNIKILLQPLLASGALTPAARVSLLASLTDEVAHHVLADNYGQNVILGVARSEAGHMASVDRRMIAELERAGLLDRSLEFLPSDRELAQRQAAGQGLVSPEFCVLLAYSKISLVRALEEGRLADDPWFAEILRRYFPRTIIEQYSDLLAVHPLRAQIINTVVSNSLLNLGGITFVFRAMEETNSSAVDVVKAAMVVTEVFDLQEVWDQVNALDTRVATAEQDRMHLEMRRLLDRATRWILQRHGSAIDVAGMIEHLRPLVQTWAPHVPVHMRGIELANMNALRDEHVAAGVPSEVASRVTGLLDSFALLDVFRIAEATGEAADRVLPLYYAFNDRYQIDPALTRITGLSRDSRWDTLARLALRSDLYAATASIVERIARATDAGAHADARIAAWEGQHQGAVTRARATLDEILALDQPTLASMSVLLRVMRNLAG